MPLPSRRRPHSADQAAGRCVPPRELDSGCLADHAAPPVAPDEIFRAQRLAARQLDVDAGVILRETGHLTFAIDRNAELAGPARERALDVDLRQREPMVVRGGKVAHVQGNPGESRDLHRLPLRQEPISDSTLLEDLDGARVQTARALANEVLAGAPLDDGNVDLRQRQLARQHQPCRSSSRDHHRVPGHRHTRPQGTQVVSAGSMQPDHIGAVSA
jgi:hypothetical protein